MPAASPSCHGMLSLPCQARSSSRGSSRSSSRLTRAGTAPGAAPGSHELLLLGLSRARLLGRCCAGAARECHGSCSCGASSKSPHLCVSPAACRHPRSIPFTQGFAGPRHSHALQMGPGTWAALQSTKSVKSAKARVL